MARENRPLGQLIEVDFRARKVIETTKPRTITRLRSMAARAIYSLLTADYPGYHPFTDHMSDGQALNSDLDGIGGDFNSVSAFKPRK